MSPSALKLIEEYRATGRIVFVKRMKGEERVSMNGGAYLPMKDALTKMKEFLRKPNPALAHPWIIRAQGSGPLMHFDGKKFSERARVEQYATKAAAIRQARKLIRANPILSKYKVSVADQFETRRVNPAVRDSAELAESQKLFREFTGHKGNTVLRRHIKPIKVGLAFGILDDVGYTTVRDGVVEAYRHTFRKKSRPLLIASHDGKQLGIVGGHYQFTEAGIEDR